MSTVATLSSLPSPVPEETLASWLDRIFIHSDNFHRRASRRSVLGAPWRNVSGLLPYRLREFADSVGQHFYSDAELLNRHTFYPYFVAGLSKGTESELARRIFEGGRGPLCPAREPLGLTARPDVKRRCPRCEMEDIQSRGFYVERRYNIAPFVTRCPFHGDYLSILGDGVESELASFRWKEVQSDAVRRNAQRFASETQSLLEGRGVTRSMCCHRLKAIGYVTEKGSLRAGALVGALRNYFADGFEDGMLSQLTADEYELRQALQRISRAHRSIHPVFLALLSIFADAHDHKTPEDVETRPVSVWRYQDIDASHIEGCNSVTEVARKLGVAAITATQLLKRSGHAGKFKVRFTDDIPEAIVRELETGQPIITIAERYNVSPLRVYRLMRSTQGLLERRRALGKDAELRLRRARAEAVRIAQGRVITVGEFRNRCRPDYQWLFKHDKDWLNAYLGTLAKPVAPPRRRRRSSLNAKAVASEADLLSVAYGAATQADEHRPYRASRKRIATLLKLNDHAVKVRERFGSHLPAEQDDAFVLRRLKWLETLSPEMAGRSATSRLKAAGLRGTKQRRAICAAAYEDD